MNDELRAVVGVRFSSRGPLVWFRAGLVSADAGSWVVGERDGLPRVGQVIVGRGQCLSFPADPASLAPLMRSALAEELTPPTETAGQKLLDSLP